MSIELSIMGALLAFFNRKFSTVNCLFILIPILVLGRFIGVGCIYFMSLFMKLPAKYIAGASLLSGWPGIILMIFLKISNRI